MNRLALSSLYRIALFATVLLLLNTPDATQAQNWSQPVFGAVEASVRPAEAAQLGISWERLSFHWNLFQPNSADDFNTEAINGAALDAALSSGRQVVGLIQGTPPWAALNNPGSPAAIPVGLELPYDDPNNVFANFVSRLVEHYSTRGIHHWIIWNEPDIRPGEGHVEFEGELEDYFLLLKSGYMAAKAADPGAHIQIAGLTWWYDTERGREPYLQRLLARISEDPEARANNWYFDGISMHIYFTTSTVSYLSNSYQTILGNFGLGNKQVWLNEFNASPRRDPVTPLSAPFNISLEQQADFIVQASAIAIASGVDRLSVYKLYDNDFTPGQSEPWGLVRHDGSLRPAYTAYQQVISDFRNASNIRYNSTGEASLVSMQQGGRTVYVMWNDTFNEAQFLLYAGGNVTVRDAYGGEWVQPFEDGVVVIDAPAAEQIDMPSVVVSGPVRIVSLGGYAQVIFRGASGDVPLN